MDSNEGSVEGSKIVGISMKELASSIDELIEIVDSVIDGLRTSDPGSDAVGDGALGSLSDMVDVGVSDEVSEDEIVVDMGLISLIGDSRVIS